MNFNHRIRINNLLNPEDSFAMLNIRFIELQEYHGRIAETWKITVRGDYSLYEVIDQIFQWYETRIPFMQRGENGVPIGYIQISSSSQTNIHLQTTSNPTFDEVLAKIDSLLTSGYDHINVDDLIFTLHLRRNPMAGTQGLVKYRGCVEVDGGPNHDCFIRLLLFHCLKFDETSRVLTGKSFHFSSHTQGSNVRKRAKGLKLICDDLNAKNGLFERAFLKLKMLLNEQCPNEVPNVSQFYINEIVKIFPTLQIVVWYHSSKEPLSTARGSSFNKNQLGRTLHMIYFQNIRHVQYISALTEFLDKKKGFCFDCCQVFPKRSIRNQITTKWGKPLKETDYLETHTCHELVKCLCCTRPQSICDSLKYREDHAEDEYSCQSCHIKTHSIECLQYHSNNSMCKKIKVQCPNCGFHDYETRIKQHECGINWCSKCKQRLPLEHKCCFPMDKSILHGKNRSPNRYYAYDIEAVLKDLPETRSIPYIDENGNTRIKEVALSTHHINCIVVQEIIVHDRLEDIFENFNQPLLFHTFDEFFEWVTTIPGEDKYHNFFAHNNSKYDARMLMLGYYQRRNTIPEIIWGGQRILCLNLPHEDPSVKLNFRDSMHHISGPLSNFKKTFGLPKIFKKGFFPYKLNQENNIVYDDIPPASYFEPEKMSEEQGLEFQEWYATKKGRPYDIQEELELYCKQDVLILKLGLEVYMYNHIKSVQGMGEEYTEVIVNPMDTMTIAGHCLKLYQALDYDSKLFPIYPLSEDHSEKVQEAFHGGRTDVRCVYYKRKPDEKILYIDIVSLYPTVQIFDPMPYGIPVENNNPQLEDLHSLFGYAKIDFQVLEYHYHPVCTLKVDGKLRADLEDKVGIIEVSQKIQWMLNRPHLYRISKVYWTVSYQQTYDMFTSYMNRCLRDKSLASKTLSHEEGIAEAQKFYESSGGKIDFRKEAASLGFEKNPGQKTNAKLIANSLWGKITQRAFEEYTSVQHLNVSQFQLASSKELNGSIRFVHPPQHFIDNETREELYLCVMDGPDKNTIKPRNSNIMQLEKKDEPLSKLNSKIIGAMVTASAQIRLLTAMEVLGERVLYHDTDSIVCVLKQNDELPPEIKLGECIGEWEQEHPTKEEGFIDEFVAIAPKAYAMRFSNPAVKDLIKIKGCSRLNSRVNAHVDFNAIRDMMLGRRDRFFVEALDIRFHRKEMKIKSSDQAKMVRPIVPKGVRVGNRIFPMGYDRFPLGVATAERYIDE